MLFHSYLFVFIFLPVSLAGFHAMAGKGEGKAAKVWLTAMSLWFYAGFGLQSLAVLLGSVAFNYAVYRWLGRTGRKAVFAMGILANLGVLAYFKYTGFLLDNLRKLEPLGLFGGDGADWESGFQILLPVGISFFTFQQISFLADVFRGEIQSCGFWDYLLYILYFPKLVEGPLVNHSELLPEFAAIGRKRFDGEQFIRGIALFVMGMLKKVILADTFGGAVDYGYANLSAMHGSDALLLVVFYSLQLYFDFSGYCDMARGVGRMFGIGLPVNFHSPYQACNIIDFWKRWHMTLSRFFTKYVYIPLGGNRKGKAKMYRNLLAVFLFSGIWHGAGWNFILWGMMHGVLYVVTRMWQEGRTVQKVQEISPIRQESGQPGNGRYGKQGVAGRAAGCLVRGICVLATFVYVSVAWVYFRAADVAQGSELLAKLFQNDFVRVNRNLAGYFNLDEFWYVLKVLRLDRWEYGHYILMAAITAGSLLLVFLGKNAAWMAERMKPKAWNAALLAAALLWCVLTFSQVGIFLYVNF